MSYATLNQREIVATIARLHRRISERFPDANLTRVSADLVEVGDQHAANVQRVLRADWRLRAVSAVLLVLGVGALALLLASVRSYEPENVDLIALLQSIESGLSMLFLLAASVVLLTSLELRRKRRRCLEALHELRALAHVVDMHQLTKDPDHALHPGVATTSSPARPMTPFELARYLDYCSEMLALMGKLAALYAQSFHDPEAIAAVDAIEDLTTGLSRKIWQKIMILEERRSEAPRVAGPEQ